MVDITLLEVHLEDASFTANAPFSSDSEASDGGESDTGRPSKLLLGTIVLGLLGALIWWRRRGSVPDIDEDIEVTV